MVIFHSYVSLPKGKMMMTDDGDDGCDVDGDEWWSHVIYPQFDAFSPKGLLQGWRLGDNQNLERWCFHVFSHTEALIMEDHKEKMVILVIFTLKWWLSMGKSLYTGAFAHRSFYTEESLDKGAFTQGSFYTQTRLHTEAFTQRSLYTEGLLYTEAFAHWSFYTEELLHTDDFARRSSYSEKLWSTETFTKRTFYTEEFLHTASFYTEKLLHTASFYTEELLHTELLHADAFTYRSFETQKFLPYTEKSSHRGVFLQTKAFTQRLHTETFTHKRVEDPTRKLRMFQSPHH